MKFSVLLCSLVFFAAQQVPGDEFGTLVNAYGTTRVLAGEAHTSTSNPDGSAINFWVAGYENAPANTVSLSNPHMAGADAYGNVYIADKASHSILRISVSGVISTFAGTHGAGFNGDGPALATNLQISNPNGLYVLPDGTVYLLDPGNRRIRRVGTNGIMTTIVNDSDPAWLSSGRALWVSSDEQLIYYTHELAPIGASGGGTNTVADGAVVKKWTPTGVSKRFAAKRSASAIPGNIAVNPIDGLLYVTDRAEDDASKLAPGLFRIDGPEQRTRITGNITQPMAADGQLAIHSYIDGTRGIAFRADGSYFLCGHRDGSVWFVDTSGVIHRYLRGAGRRDAFLISDGMHPPLVDQEYFAQPRAVTLAPNGNLLVVCNDSGYVFEVLNVEEPRSLTDLHLDRSGTNGVRLTWSGEFSRAYRVERSASPLGNWQRIGAAGGGLQGARTTVHDPAAAGQSQGYYRVLPSL